MKRKSINFEQETLKNLSRFVVHQNDNNHKCIDIEDLKKAIIEYIDDSHLRKAIMINGKWGTGKTFFIKKLLDEYKKDTVYKFPTGAIIYVSLYGISNAKELEEAILKGAVPINDKINKKIKNTLENALNKMLPGSGELLNLLDQNLAGNIFIKKLKAIIVFDDLERCCMNYTELLGNLNYYVEQENKKIIIIGNEEEITDEAKEILDKEKEKSIGLTLYFNNNLLDSYDEIVYSNNNVLNNDSKSFFTKNKNYIIDTLSNINELNLRTFISSIQYFDKFNSLIPEQYGIEFKEKHQLDIWLYIRSILFDNEKKTFNSNVMYKSIDDYINYGFLNKELFKEEIGKYKTEYYNTKSLTLYKLEKWQFLDDTKIISFLDNLKKELSENKYTTLSFQNLIQTFIELKQAGFNIPDNELIKSMAKLIDYDYEIIDGWELDNYIDEDNELYSYIVKSIREIVLENYNRFIIEKSKIINEIWNESFIEFCKKDFKSYLVKNGGFLYYLNLENAKQNINKNNESIYYFYQGLIQINNQLASMACSSRICLIKDTEKVLSLINFVNDYIKNNKSNVTRYHLEILKKILNKYYNLINNKDNSDVKTN